MKPLINLAIQILPTTVDKSTAYSAVDAAISIIKKSGLNHLVCPFETVIEGDYDTVMSVVKEMQEEVFNNNIDHILVNIKIQRSKNSDVFIDDKLSNYK